MTVYLVVYERHNIGLYTGRYQRNARPSLPCDRAHCPTDTSNAFCLVDPRTLFLCASFVSKWAAVAKRGAREALAFFRTAYWNVCESCAPPCVLSGADRQETRAGETSSSCDPPCCPLPATAHTYTHTGVKFHVRRQ